MADIALLPPAFDPAYYIEANPDLGLSLQTAADHYARHGKVEGRVASPLALRENLVALIDDGRSVLEIGPFCSPLLRGPNIAYLDVLDADRLRARAREIGIDPAGCPAKIHYVGGLEQVHRRFGAVVSSHAIEHQPDLIRHLGEVERLLVPDGLFCLMIPDKRFCFDHHIAESTIADVVQAYREQRRLHSLSSVIEHVALTTHNDAARHWAGDHGPAASDRAARIRAAISDYDRNPGAYIDVHAWYFTPDSFRTIVDDLAALGLTGLEVAGVYDSARDRNEFCAVLRLGPAARERAEGRGTPVVILQTADADRYAPMLAASAPGAREYARRHGLGYEDFIGVKRGSHPWQATYNRIPMLVDLMARGFTGWALYLDADAYIQDLDFDLAAYLADKQDRAAIFATSGVTGEHWDVNAGVALINLGHPLGRALVEQWAAGFAALDDDLLRASAEWLDTGNDQDLLHGILRRDAAIAAATLIEPMSFINGPHARFIRQHLRTHSSSLEERIATIREAVAAVFRWDMPASAPARPASASASWAARLAHPDVRETPLIEAPIAAPRFDLAADPAQAADFAALGRSPLAEGHLGGPRQHRRAENPEFAGQLARWTHDKLISLAEAIGVLPLENPEAGRWGVNAQADPSTLFRLVSEALDADLTPPEHVGGYLGIAVGEGVVLHMRMIDAIHAAWRLRQLADMLGVGGGMRIAEIGGGIGLTAFYARRLGLGRYRLFDGAALNAAQAYLLGGSDGVESDESFAGLVPGAIDLLFNSDTLPGMGRATAIAHLRTARRIGVPHILSINQETPLPDRPSMSGLIEEAGGYRRAARHRHWLRVGYVEEHFVRNG